MDTTKQNPLPQAQESDDLIAELARLVAQDARSQSVNSAVYSQPEPEPEPQVHEEPYQEPEPEYGNEPEEVHTYTEVPEPAFAYGEERRQPEPAFDFGFMDKPSAVPDDYAGEDIPAQSNRDYDPIADLIASAEEENFAADEEPGVDSEDDFFAVEPVHSGFANLGNGRDAGSAQAYQEPRFSQEPDYSSNDELQQPPSQHTSGDNRDPLSEIEALIGEAARVSVGAGMGEGRKVRSAFLDTSDYQDIKADRAVDAAESAILAAAAASGARVAHVQPVEDVPPEPEIPAEFADVAADQERGEEVFETEDYVLAGEEERPYRRSRRGGFLLPAVAGTAIVALLAGGYFVFLAPDPVPSEAPVLTADAGDMKEIPETAPVATTASESVIFNEIDGNTVPPENEALVSRDQTNGATGAEVGSVIAPEEGETGLANRPVRTVTVRPDGTIVSSDNSVAGSNVLPVERPDVPAVPNSTLTSDPIGEAIAAAIADEPLTPATAEPMIGAVSAEPASESAPAAENTIVDPATIPRPVPRPSGLAAPQASQQPAQTLQPPVEPTQVATAPAQPAAAQPAPVTPAGVGAWVQLSSQRSEEAARAGMPDLQSRYGALFNGAALDVSRVDLGDRGVYYRVRLPQPTMADANSVCNAIKGQGGDCFVLNN